MSNNVELTDKQQSAIDRAIAAAKARTEAKERQAQIEEESGPKKSKEEREAERAEAKERHARERAERRAAKEAARSERENNRGPAHMIKVVRAGEKLPQLDDETRTVMEYVRDHGLSLGQTTTLCAHLQHLARIKATLASAEVRLEQGQQVRILSSDRDPRLIGKIGTISQVRKIRVLVSVPGQRNEAYLFASDVCPITEDTTEVETITTDETPSEPVFLAPEEDTSEESTGTEG